MKRKTKKSNKFLPVVLFIVGLLAVAGIVFAALKLFGVEKLFNKETNDSVSTSNTTQTQNNQNTIVDAKPKPEQNTNPEYKEKEPIIQYSGEDPNLTGIISGAVTYTGISNDTLIIRVNIDQYINEGNCILSLTGANTNYTEAARVIDSASTATCEGFNVPLSQIKDNSVNIVIEVKTDDKRGIIRGNASL